MSPEPKKKLTPHKSKASRSTPKPSGYWDHFTNLERELRAFIAKYGETGLMPTKRTLKAKGLNGLVSAISKHGGIFVVAERLGLNCSESHKPSGYWHDFDNKGDSAVYQASMPVHQRQEKEIVFYFLLLQFLLNLKTRE